MVPDGPPKSQWLPEQKSALCYDSAEYAFISGHSLMHQVYLDVACLMVQRARKKREAYIIRSIVY